MTTPSSREIDRLLDYTLEDALEARRLELQKTELEQNTLDGFPQSFYTFTRDDALLHISDTADDSTTDKDTLNKI